MPLTMAIVMVLALLAFGGFVVLFAGLFFQGRDLVRSAMAFRDETAPVVAEITRGSEEAQRKGAVLQEKAAALQGTAESFTKARSRRRR